MKNLSSFFIFLLAFAIASNAQWQQTNGPYGGYINDIMVDGSNIYVVAGGSLYKSTNGGMKWNTIMVDTMGIVKIVKDSNFLFIGTKKGVYKSSDDGLRWNLSGNIGAQLFVTDMILNDATLIIAASDSVFTSADYGETWISKNDGVKDWNTISLAATGNSIFRGEIVPTLIGGGPDPVMMYKSTDNGENWSQKDNGLGEYSVRSLALGEGNIYAGTEKGVYISTDGGEHWMDRNVGLTNLYIVSLAVNGSEIYAGTSNGIFKSTNTGFTWKAISAGILGSQIRVIKCESNSVYIGTTGGLFVSADKGANWQNLSDGIVSTTSFCLLSVNDTLMVSSYETGLSKTGDKGDHWVETHVHAATPFVKLFKNGNQILGNTYLYNVPYHSTDNGVTWDSLKGGLEEKNVRCFAISGNHLIAGTSLGIFLSDDNAETWTKVYPSVQATPFLNFATENNDVYGSSNIGIYKSSDNGENWSSILKSVTNFSTGKSSSLFVSIFVLNGEIYGGSDVGLFKSTDGGENWKLINSGLPDTYVSKILKYGHNLLAATNKGIFYSTNYGENWDDMNTGLTNKYIYDALIINDEIYVATGGSGVFKANLSEFGLTGIKDETISDNSEFMLSPIPANNLLNIQTGLQHFVVEIYNSNGIKMLSDENQREISTYGLQPGIYYCTIKSGKTIQSKKFVIIR